MFAAARTKVLLAVALPLLLVMPRLWATEEQRFELLPVSALSATMKQCSRATPHATGAWMPSTAQLLELESQLPQLATLATQQGISPSIGDRTASFRQYLGVIVDGHRFIYVNAALSTEKPAKAAHLASQGAGTPFRAEPKPIIVCDGGNYFWGVLYDPETKKFSQLETNGFA
jgi:hypothetical protein